MTLPVLMAFERFIDRGRDKPLCVFGGEVEAKRLNGIFGGEVEARNECLSPGS